MNKKRNLPCLSYDPALVVFYQLGLIRGLDCNKLFDSVGEILYLILSKHFFCLFLSEFATIKLIFIRWNQIFQDASKQFRQTN
jgi:hypothetical protein